MDDKTFAELFAKEVSGHELTIIKDDGLYRHLRFTEPVTCISGFDIITWPWHLCYTGDMGTYVFSRIQDMFEFFRGRKPNMGYWAEKALSVDKQCGIKEYSPDAFERAINDEIDVYCENLNDDDSEDLRAAVEDEVLACANEGEEQARFAADDFKFNGNHIFSDFWECDLTEFTHHYKWCCHALVWAIAKYDEVKK